MAFIGSDVAQVSPEAFASPRTAMDEVVAPSQHSSRPAIKVTPDNTGHWTIFQGFTWVPEIKKAYTSWDLKEGGKSQVVIMRHDPEGAFELRSGDVSQYITHGQDLGHAFYKGKLYLFSASVDGRGVTVFTPPTTNCGPIGDIHHFTLFPEGWVVAFPNESSDFRSIVATAWDTSRSDNPYFSRVFDFDRLMEGPDGDRSGEAVQEVNLSPKDDYWGHQKNTIQSATTDVNSLYVLTGTDVISDPKYISAFNLGTGKRLWRMPLKAGSQLASGRGMGKILEYEGLAWVKNRQGELTLWVGLRMQNKAGTGSEMYVMPIQDLVSAESKYQRGDHFSAAAVHQLVVSPAGMPIAVHQFDAVGRLIGRDSIRTIPGV